MSVKLKDPEEVFVVLLAGCEPNTWLDKLDGETSCLEEARVFLTEESAKAAIETNPDVSKDSVVEKQYAWMGFHSITFVPYYAIDHVSDAPVRILDKNGVEYIRQDLVPPDILPKDVAMRAIAGSGDCPWA